MNSAEMPAMPVPGLSDDPDFNGLTKREQFCIAMGIPGTGDTELDDIIRAGVRQKHAALAMQGLLSADASEMDTIGEVALKSVELADALLANLEEPS